MRSLVTMANGTASAVYGNVAQNLKEYIISRFPENYFKYISLSSELSYRNMSRLFGKNRNDELKKREKPYLIIQPTYTSRDKEMSFYNVPFTRNNVNLEYGVDPRYLLPIMTDEENGLGLIYKFNRDRIEFDATITLTTLHQQLDMYQVMRNTIPWEITTARPMPLEANIPRNIIEYIGRIYGTDIVSNSEYVPVLINKMNKWSIYPITYKLRNTNNRDEWFMTYMQNVLITFSDIEIGEGNRRNMIMDDFPITFKVTAEFNFPGAFFLESYERKNFTFGGAITVTSTDDTAYIPFHIANSIENKFPSEYNGLQLHSAVAYSVEEHRLKEDRVDIGSLFPTEQKNALQLYHNMNGNMSPIVQFKHYKDETLLEYGKDYIFDESTLNVIVYNPLPSSKYRIGTYINMKALADIQSSTVFNRPYGISELKDNKLD